MEPHVKVKGHGLGGALQNLANDLVDYVDARGRLLRAQAAGVVAKAGSAVAMGVAALISLVVAYFLALGLIVALLSRLFGGQALWPLLMVSLAHLVIAVALAFMSLRSWQSTDSHVEGPPTSSPYPAAKTSSWTTPEISAN